MTTKNQPHDQSSACWEGFWIRGKSQAKHFVHFACCHVFGSWFIIYLGRDKLSSAVTLCWPFVERWNESCPLLSPEVPKCATFATTESLNLAWCRTHLVGWGIALCYVFSISISLITWRCKCEYTCHGLHKQKGFDLKILTDWHQAANTSSSTQLMLIRVYNIH